MVFATDVESAKSMIFLMVVERMEFPTLSASATTALGIS